jgi:hypothetical protein
VGRNVVQVRLNAWFGARTVSCLHHDPDHNLLCQVVGSKSVRLYHPSESHRLYPHAGMMSNTSQVRRVCGQQARTVRVCLLLSGKNSMLRTFAKQRISYVDVKACVRTNLYLIEALPSV